MGYATSAEQRIVLTKRGKHWGPKIRDVPQRELGSCHRSVGTEHVQESGTSALNSQGSAWAARRTAPQKARQPQPCFLQTHPACSAQGSQRELFVFSRIRHSVWTQVAKIL